MSFKAFSLFKVVCIRIQKTIYKEIIPSEGWGAIQSAVSVWLEKHDVQGFCERYSTRRRSTHTDLTKPILDLANKQQ